MKNKFGDFDYQKCISEKNLQEELEFRKLGSPPKLEDYDLSEEDIEKIQLKADKRNSFSGTCRTIVFLIVLICLVYGLLIRKSLDGVILIIYILIAVGLYIPKTDTEALIVKSYPIYKNYLLDRKKFINDSNLIRKKYKKNRFDLEYQNHMFWLNLSGKEFEIQIQEWFRRHGYFASLTNYSNDKGIDLFVSNYGLHYIVQCKAHKNKVGPAVVRDLFGVFSTFQGKYQGAILISLSGFTSGVYDFVEGKRIILMDINTILSVERNTINLDNLLERIK